jgi:hypothetical protein
MLENLKRRLTPSERARVAKTQQANEPVELPPGQDGLAFGPSPEGQRALRNYRRAEAQAEDKRRELTIGEEPAACEMHPEWQPKQWVAGQPRPPKSRCPFCREDAKPSGKVERIEVEHPLNTKNTPAAADAALQIKERDEQKAVEQAKAKPDSFAGKVLRSPEGLNAARNGTFKRDLETYTLEAIDEGRANDRANLIPTHPDFPRTAGPFYRKAAFSTPGASKTKRAAATKYWKRQAR